MAYGEGHHYDQAVETYRQCIQISREKNWLEDLIYNYKGLSLIFENTGQYRESLDFFKKYHSLQDSLIGAGTQGKIVDLEAKYNGQQKEVELQKSQTELATTRLALERGAMLFLIVLLLVAGGLWRWRLQTRQARREGQQNQDNLTNLTRILLVKNTQLLALENQLAMPPPAPAPAVHPEDFEQNLYNQRILTEEDWSAFKVYFEKVYPGYIQRLKAANPGLSDAEKRLFLFIKLDLSRKEAAAMLGISVDSVKKTRNRLRKRLRLEEDQDLDGYIRAF